MIQRPGHFRNIFRKIAGELFWNDLQVFDFMARETGLEPATSGVTGRIVANCFKDMGFGMAIKSPFRSNGAFDGFGMGR